MDDKIKRLWEAVWGPEPPSQEHQETLSMLPTYIQAEVEGENVTQMYPEIKHHLDRCKQCSGIYADLLDTALADTEGRLPEEIDDLHGPDLDFLKGNDG